MGVHSPSSNICRMSTETGLCEGCQRTIDEIVAWSRSADAEKRAILDIVARRREQLGLGAATVTAGAAS